MKKSTVDHTIFVRYAMFMLGLAVIGLGNILTIKAHLGLAPWETFQLGLYYTFGLTIGAWSQIVGAAVIILSFLIAKMKPGLGTLLNMIFIGVFMDLFLWMDIIPEATSALQQWFFYVSGLVIISIGFGMYISPRLGAGPRDSLMLALNERAGWSIQRSRVTIEISVLAAGWMMGGPVNIGTLLFAILSGPMIQRTIMFWEKVMAKAYGRASKQPMQPQVGN